MCIRARTSAVVVIVVVGHCAIKLNESANKNDMIELAQIYERTRSPCSVATALLDHKA